MDGRVRVAVRVRPPLPSEPSANCIRAHQDRSSCSVLDPRTGGIEETRYKFDAIYCPETSQQQLFEEQVKPLLERAIEGKNCSVLAYGATNSGKTHTVFGPPHDHGIIPHAIESLLSMLRSTDISLLVHSPYLKLPNGAYTDIQFSFLELYREAIRDLLLPVPSASVPSFEHDLPIRQGVDGSIIIPNLTQIPITSLDQFNSAFQKGIKNRAMAETLLNIASSRSHAVLTIIVKRVEPTPPHRTLVGKIHIIDLAGSEDNRKTGNKGLQLKESNSINFGLLALGNVITALNSKSAFIPYRNSKLTRLLTDSLGGTSTSLLIANIAPGPHHISETLSTFQFATKAMNVVNKASNVVHTQKQHSDVPSFARPTSSSSKNVVEKKEDMNAKLDEYVKQRNELKLKKKEQTVANVEKVQLRPAGIEPLPLPATVENIVFRKMKEMFSPILKKLTSMVGGEGSGSESAKEIQKEVESIQSKMSAVASASSTSAKPVATSSSKDAWSDVSVLPPQPAPPSMISSVLLPSSSSSAPPLASKQNEDKAKELILQSKKLKKEGKFSEALELMSQVKRLIPHNTKVDDFINRLKEAMRPSNHCGSMVSPTIEEKPSKKQKNRKRAHIEEEEDEQEEEQQQEEDMDQDEDYVDNGDAEGASEYEMTPVRPSKRSKRSNGSESIGHVERKSSKGSKRTSSTKRSRSGSRQRRSEESFELGQTMDTPKTEEEKKAHLLELINCGSKEQLMSLETIGKARAESIIASRPYENFSCLANSGLTMKQIEKFITQNTI